MRARNIKPGFFENDLLVELPFEFRLLFIGLWTMADKSGRLEDRPKKIKMCVFPADDVDVNRGLTELNRYGFINRYEAVGVQYIQIVNWEKHQRPHHTEKESVIPPCNNGEITVNQRNQDRGNPPDLLIPDSLIPDSGLSDNISASSPSGSQSEIPEKKPSVYSQDFEAFWAAYPSRQGKKVGKAEAFREWKKAVKEVEGEFLIAKITELAPQYGDYPKDACRWLKNKQWEDEMSGYVPASEYPDQFAGVI